MDFLTVKDVDKYSFRKQTSSKIGVTSFGLKVGKFQKQIFLLSFDPKTEQNCVSISALRI